MSANLGTLFDVGSIVGGILAGLLSDVTGMSAITCSVMLLIAVPLVSISSFRNTVDRNDESEIP